MPRNIGVGGILLIVHENVARDDLLRADASSEVGLTGPFGEPSRSGLVVEAVFHVYTLW